MKPGKTFKLSKPTKTMLASIVDKEQRNAWKRAMIDAQVSGEMQSRNSQKRSKNSEQE